jgi:GNAT superfamily N-acetyltransferase
MSIFGDVELARRIERLDADLMRDAADAARRRSNDPRAVALDAAGGVAAWARAGAPLNKVVGVGFAGTLTETDWARVEQMFAAQGEPVRFEVSTLAEPAVHESFSRRGYTLVGFEHVLGLALREHAFTASANASVIHPDEVEIWIDTLVDAFSHPDEVPAGVPESFPRELLVDLLRDSETISGWSRWIARDAGVVAGAASMRIQDGVAQLSGAATLPAHRRRGIQSALLGTRLAWARESGCELAVVTTQPGSKSQQNLQRQGFALLYARALWVRQ